MFQKFAFAPLFHLFAKFPFILFAEDLVENFDKACSSWDISSFDDSDDEPVSVYVSFDDKS